MAAAGNDSIAHMVLGYRYANGITVPIDCDKAVYHYYHVVEKVIESFKKSTLSLISKQRLRRLGRSYINGSYSSNHDVVHYYQYAAEHGDTMAQVNDNILKF
jgi:hypothetical protein